MSLDERQLNVVKKLTRQVTTELESLPFGEAAERCEGISIILAQFGFEEAAEAARHLSCVLGQGQSAHQELLEILHRLL